MLRFIFLITIIAFAQVALQAQELPPGTQQQLESLAEFSENELEDDAILQDLAFYKDHPLNLNAAGADDLHPFSFLSALQIQNFLAYRKALGSIISIYELQAVPGWDLQTIRKLLPYISIRQPVGFSRSFLPRLTGGSHYMLMRTSRTLEKVKGYDTSLANHYLGNPGYLLFRYQYKYNNLLQYGFTAEKDAGEQFFKGAQSKGFDFYSFHLIARDLGCFKTIVLGDFSTNLGQGLVQWQSLAFTKGSEVASIKRQAPVLKPYTSAGEFYFNRGVGFTLKKGNAELTLFGSARKLDANIVSDTSKGASVSSFISSGLHRTSSEIADRSSLRQHSLGGNISWNPKPFHAGFNAVYHSFSIPIEKRSDPYNLFALKGRTAFNMSTDYSFTLRNIHFFGEAAVDQNYHTAFLNGVLVSLDPKVDLSMLHRYYEKDYVTVYGKAFSENSLPTNETGLYMGVRIRLFPTFTVNAYSDVYQFAWLKYRTDAPSVGCDYFIQFAWQPNKLVELYARYRNEQKSMNNSSENGVMNELSTRLKQHGRIHFSYQLNSRLSWQNRMEVVWYKKGDGQEEKGFMFFTGMNYKPLKRLSANGRILFFETPGFDSRIYTYENDVLYSFSTPFYYGNGLRYYVNLNFDVSKSFSLWLKFSRTGYRDGLTVGSGSSEILGNSKSDIKLQAMLQF